MVDLKDGDWYRHPDGKVWRYLVQGRGYPDVWRNHVGEFHMASGEHAAPGPFTPADRPPVLLLERSITVSAEQKVDLVAVFTAMNASQQQAYIARDLDEFGYEEWERPMAWLHPDLDGVGGILDPGWGTGYGHEQIDYGESSVEVRYRADSDGFVRGADAGWTEADFTYLRQQVPWLDTAHALLDGIGDTDREEHLARMPGPDDSPLFE